MRTIEVGTIEVRAIEVWTMVVWRIEVDDRGADGVKGSGWGKGAHTYCSSVHHAVLPIVQFCRTCSCKRKSYGSFIPECGMWPSFNIPHSGMDRHIPHSGMVPVGGTFHIPG